MPTETRTERLQLRIRPSLRTAVEAEAVKQDRSVTWIIEKAVAEYLDKQKDSTS